MGKYLYSTDDSDKIKEIVREAESKLAAQLDIATAADQRALTFAGLLVAAVALLTGAATASGAVAAHAIALMLLASILLAGAGCALWSARPTEWRIAGNEPSLWLDDLQGEHDSMNDCLAAMAEFYDDFIIRNGEAIEAAAWWMRASLAVTASGMLVAVLVAWTIVLGRGL